MTYSSAEFLFYPELQSTNNEMKRLCADRKLGEQSVVITANQTAGKGQGGNMWESEVNKNLTFSLLLRPEFLAPHLQFYISKIVSLGIADCMTALLKRDVSIKWPNDIYVGDKKLAGILIENSICGSKLDYCIVGIGLNVNQEVFVSDAPNPISIKQLLWVDTGLEALLEDLLARIEERYHQLEINRLDLINTDYFNVLYRKDGTHLFKDVKGVFEASIKSINELGLITLEDKEGLRREYAFKELRFM